MVSFNYQKHDSWGEIGWLGRDEYYNFWGNIFATELFKFFKNRTVLDIGAGNGRLWQEAFNQGLLVTELHLIDPALNISPSLSKRREVIEHKTNIENLKHVPCDVVVFKQSVHHIYQEMGAEMFKMFDTPVFINFSMPENPDWPISKALRKRFALSYLDVEQITQNAGKTILHKTLISYPVVMNKKEWHTMLEQRFTSILHDCDDAFIRREQSWVNDNFPEKIAFYDHLECHIFR